MQFNKKIFNNRLSNQQDNLGSQVTGITKDINELSQLILSMEKYGNHTHQLKNHVQQERIQLMMRQQLANMSKANVDKKQEVDINEKEGLLGKIPEGVESVAELMLWDSDVNVYSENKVKLKEEAFTIRGKKQKTKVQKEQIIIERRAQARAKYEQIKKE